MECFFDKKDGCWSLIGKYNNEEVLLARITNYFDTNNWILQDARYVSKPEFFKLTPFLIEMHNQLYNYESKEEKQFILNIINETFIDEDNKAIFYDLYSTYILNGDIPIIKRYYKDEIRACWSFHKAKEKIYEIEKFWKTFDSDIRSAAIESPFSQPTPYELKFLWQTKDNL